MCDCIDLDANLSNATARHAGKIYTPQAMIVFIYAKQLLFDKITEFFLTLARLPVSFGTLCTKLGFKTNT